MKCGYYLTGTKTATNLAKAFAGECQARTRYLFYAETAGSENYPTIQQIFLETADNERGHAEIFNDYLTTGLEKSVLSPQVLVPVALGDTAQNLCSAAEGEHLEWTSLYPEFGHVAEQEGFCDIAESFYKIASIEKRHDARYSYLLERLNKGMLYQLNFETTWICSNCGLYIKDKSAPDICPACHHPQSFYMTIFDQTYPYGYPKEKEPCLRQNEGYTGNMNDYRQKW